MAQTLQQLVDLIRSGGASKDAKRIDDAVKAFEAAAFVGFGADFGDRLSGIQGLTCRQVLATIGLALKSYRASAAQQDALDRTLAIIQRELG
jgi:hypothetical protein